LSIQQFYLQILENQGILNLIHCEFGINICVFAIDCSLCWWIKRQC